jgi:hypothetical protein
MICALDESRVTLTFRFTPDSDGIRPHHTSPSRVPEEYAEFCAGMVARYVIQYEAPRRPSSSPSAQWLPLF